MGAIYGVFNRRLEHVAEHFSTMPEALTSYGTEENKPWTDGIAHLGFLKRVVKSETCRKEQLPGHNVSADLALTADTRLDNREELAKTLGISLDELSEMSDSLLIIRAYQYWGFDCPKYLLGDFTFVIWDKQNKTLFCARDPLGIKPFYYSLTADRFVFSSDIKGVLAGPGVSQQLNEAYVAASLKQKFFSHNEYTFYQGIIKLPSAHFIIIRPDNVRIERYWFPENTADIRYQSETDYAEAALEILQQAVNARVSCQDPVGVHLSGGLDSSAISVLAAQALKRQGKPPPAAFCWQPPPDNSNSIPVAGEHALIHSICQQEGLTPSYLSLTADDYITNLKQDSTKNPTETTLVAEQALQKQAQAQGVRVLLSGWGGDEGISFNGRGYFADLLVRGRWWQFYRENNGNPFKNALAHLVIAMLPMETQRILYNFKKRGWERGSKMYINPDFSRKVKRISGKHFVPVGVRNSQCQLLNRGHLQERIEAWAASGARHNIEYRYPLLDRRVVEFALALPPEQYVRGEWRRWIMRNTISGIVPKEVCWNQSPGDPVRCQSTQSVIPHALMHVGQTLAARSTMPARAEYLDMPRLIEDLTTNFDPENHKNGKLRPALHLLDW